MFSNKLRRLALTKTSVFASSMEWMNLLGKKENWFNLEKERNKKERESIISTSNREIDIMLLLLNFLLL